MSLQISIREYGSVTILDLQGRLHAGEDGELLNWHLRKLTGKGKTKLLLHLGRLTQIDSSGVSIIAKTHGTLKRAGGNLGLLKASGNVLDVFKVLHLLNVIPSFEDETQALMSFQSIDSTQEHRVPGDGTLFG